MKTIKKFQIALTITVISLFIGCSDSLITQNESESDNGQSEVSSEMQSANQFRMKIKLEPQGTYSFDHENTGFYTFNSINIADCMKLTSNYEITGYGDDFMVFLTCNSRDFSVWSITVRNNSQLPVETEVVLTGSANKVINPKLSKNDLH